MALILGIETSTETCSVALGLNGICIAIKKLPIPNGHASLLHNLVNEVFSETNYSLHNLDAIAISIGPGSYTGLRVGVSSVKGFAFALNIPVIAVNTLQSLAAHFIELFPINDSLLVPMIDARRMEVYTAVYHTNLIVNQETNAQIISESSFLELLKNYKLAIFGNGSEKCKSVITHPNASFFANVDCCASGLISIAQKRFSQNEFVNLAYFEPFYLKDFIPTTPKK